MQFLPQAENYRSKPTSINDIKHLLTHLLLFTLVGYRKFQIETPLIISKIDLNDGYHLNYFEFPKHNS